MTSPTGSQLLEQLGVAKTHNRPYTSIDALSPSRNLRHLNIGRSSRDAANRLNTGKRFAYNFSLGITKCIIYSGIAWLTPESVHYQQPEVIIKQRPDVPMQAFLANPECFNIIDLSEY